MTRKQAEKIAAAVVAVARTQAARAGAERTWVFLHLPLADLAGALGRTLEDTTALLWNHAGIVHGCLPLGWSMGNWSNPDVRTVVRTIRAPEGK